MTPEPQSMCATHPEVPALATCSRCGRFICEACTTEPELVLCTACERSATDPFQLKTAPFSVGGALVEGFKLTLREAGTIIGVGLVFAVADVALQALVPAQPGEPLGNSWRLSVFFEGLVGFIGTQAVLARLIARAEGRVVSVGRAFSLSLQTWGRCFGSNFRAGLSILGFALLLIVPGVWRAVQLLFVDIAVLRSTKNPLEVSKQLVENRGWAVFGLACASVAVTTGPAFVVAAVAGAAGQLLELPVAGELISGWVFNVSAMVQSSVLLVAYYGLTNSSGEPLPTLPFRAPIG